jgi:hypothetical protein
MTIQGIDAFTGTYEVEFVPYLETKAEICKDILSSLLRNLRTDENSPAVKFKLSVENMNRSMKEILKENGEGNYPRIFHNSIYGGSYIYQRPEVIGRAAEQIVVVSPNLGRVIMFENNHENDLGTMLFTAERAGDRNIEERLVGILGEEVVLFNAETERVLHLSKQGIV